MPVPLQCSVHVSFSVYNMTILACSTKYWFAKAAASAEQARHPGVTGSADVIDDGFVLDVDARDRNAAPGRSSEKAALVDATSAAGAAGGPPPPGMSIMVVARAVWLEGLVVWLVFAVSFTVFPGIAPFAMEYKGSTTGGFNTMWWQQVRRFRVQSQSCKISLEGSSLVTMLSSLSLRHPCVPVRAPRCPACRCS